MIHKLLTHKQAAELLGISRETFRKWVRVKNFPQVDIGRVRTKILEKDVLDYVKATRYE